MIQPVYILSACAISPQESFDAGSFTADPSGTNDGKLFVKDPDYTKYISPVAIRRMSRQMKMGITAGMAALVQAGVKTPDAIITGTSLGSMTDMEHFLKDMIRLNEEALNPTYFIQSTYNSVNGWIALQSKCIGYNQTYVHRGLSLELSLLDAQLLLTEAEEEQFALVGCFDELTDDYFIIKDKVNYWKKQLPESLNLLNHSESPGTIAGEGTAFFTVSNRADRAVCSLRGIKMLQDPFAHTILPELKQFLTSNNLSPEDIDVLIAGLNGDSEAQPLYGQVMQLLPEHIPVIGFKHLTGEYPTASGFAVWTGVQLFAGQEMPQAAFFRNGTVAGARNILIVNHYILGTVSFILLQGI